MKLMVVSNFVILFDQSESILARFFDVFWFTPNLKNSLESSGGRDYGSSKLAASGPPNASNFTANRFEP